MEDFYSQHAEELYWYVCNILPDEYAAVMQSLSMAEFIDSNPDYRAAFWAFVIGADVE